MRIVVDTNVFVSSFFGGNPKKIIDLWKSGQVTLCLSRAIIEEYIEVLARLGLQGTRELKELLKLFSGGYNSVYAAKTPDLRVVKKDPDDDRIIECAVSLDAEYIVTGDKALLEIENYMGIGIVTPKEFLNLL